MVPDTDEMKKHFENVYSRYMGYDQRKMVIKLDNKLKALKLKNKNEINKSIKVEGKHKTTRRKKKTERNNETLDKELKIKKPRRKYERIKPKKNKNTNGNIDDIHENIKDKGNMETGQNIEANGNVENNEIIKENMVIKKKGRKSGERANKNKNKKDKDNLENDNLTILKGNPDTVFQASLDFMNPSMFT
ncbi:conserved Plasmodium protein, unknown function [Plasmodium malariae]|nr:conserved Plasmodium protein, unknown function [Plasmodium malariae]